MFQIEFDNQDTVVGIDLGTTNSLVAWMNLTKPDIIPGEDGKHDICQLVAFNLTDISVTGSWIGPGRLHLVPHVNAPVADLPVRRIVGSHHFIADLTLPYGRVIHDYLKKD